MWHELLKALALMLMLEGLLPFLLPAATRANMLRMAALSNNSLRIMGFCLVMLGCVGLHLSK